jgi:signal transduction histidine kinase
MKSPIKLRLTGFLVTVALGAILIGWTERHAWRQTDQLQQRFEAMQRGGYHLADHLEASILKLNNALLRFDLHEDPADRVRFQKDSEALGLWLARHRDYASTPGERELLRQIALAFDDYLTNAFHILEESAQIAGPGSPAALFGRAEQASNRLVDLAADLADVQRESLQLALADAQQALAELKLLLAVSLILLIVLSLMLTVIVYRGMIAPLRIKLIETRALVERQEKLASLGALAAGVAHEIRNPLTAIKARLFTQRKLLPENSESLEDNRFIGDEISRLDDIIKDFLLFARPTEPRLAMVRATAPFRELAGLFQPEMEKNSIELKCEFLADPQVHADLQQLKQVLINLIKNAAESIGRRGTITLRTRVKPGRLGTRATHVAVLEVEDTGQGIPPEVQKRLFDPFFTTKETGTGLGLSIAALILEKHGGALEYQTQAGRGTVFSVLLPIAQNHDHEPEPR